MGPLTVSDSSALAGLEAAGLRRDEVQRVASAGFAEGFGGGPEASGWRARVTVLFAHVLAAGPQGDSRSTLASKVEVGVEVELSVGRGEPARRDSAQSAEQVEPAEGLTPALRRALAGAVRKGADALFVVWKEERKSDPEILQDLGSADPGLRDRAVRVLADRKSRSAVPALIERLRDPDPEVVERVIGALGQIRDPRAVGPLIELSQEREPQVVAQIAHIIGDIGGPEAEAYLVTLASGHPEAIVRQAAEAALSEMRARG